MVGVLFSTRIVFDAEESVPMQPMELNSIWPFASGTDAASGALSSVGRNSKEQSMNNPNQNQQNRGGQQGGQGGGQQGGQGGGQQGGQQKPGQQQQNPGQPGQQGGQQKPDQQDQKR
jgi:hypothetical protein